MSGAPIPPYKPQVFSSPYGPKLPPKQKQQYVDEDGRKIAAPLRQSQEVLSSPPLQCSAKTHFKSITYLDKFLQEGSAVDIYVYNKDQIISATEYVKASKQYFPEGDVRILVSDAKVQTGDIVNERKVIRYHF